MRNSYWPVSCARHLSVAALATLLVASSRLAPPREATTDIVSLTLVPQEISAGSQASGSVRLDNAAQTSIRIDLSSADPAIAGVPASVSVPARARSATFPIRTSSDAAGCTRITARLGTGAPRFAELFVGPLPTPRGSGVRLRLDSNAVVATGTVLAHVDLAGPAPEGGTTVFLASGNPSLAAVPASIMVAPGATSQRFVVNTAVVGTSTCAVISARVGAHTSRTLLKIVGISG